MTYACTKCGTTKTETIAKSTTHSYGSWTKVNDSTHKHVCSVCGKEETASHSWNNGTVTQAATCTATGTKTHTCTACNATKTEAIPATGHQHTEIRNKKTATCTEAGYSGDTYCKDCGQKVSSGSAISAAGHSWNSGRVEKPANCTETGLKRYLCTVCDESKLETIPIDPNNHDHVWDHDEEEPYYESCGITRWYVYYNPYPVGDPRRFDDNYTVYSEWTARDDFEDEVTAARSAYSAKLKEITDNGWLKKTAGYGATGETVSYEAGTRTIHYYKCTRCGNMTTR